MWQPKQPASDTVATFSFTARPAVSDPRRPPCLVGAALADGDHEAAPLGQDHAHRADARGAIGPSFEVVSPAGRWAVHHQVRGDAAAGDGEHVLAVDLAAGAHAQLAEDAAVQVEQQIRVARVHAAVGIELLEVRASSMPIW